MFQDNWFVKALTAVILIQCSERKDLSRPGKGPGLREVAVLFASSFAKLSVSGSILLFPNRG